ncbi:MAG TPA: tetratricopeptide repeat protein, partial [Caulobacteraceae bacterium]
GGAAPAVRAPGWIAPAAALAGPLLAMALYLGIGRPDAPDQPFRDRLAQWRAQPERLGPAEAAAVLETVARERPRDAEAHGLLGRARLAAGDRFGAVRALETAARLEPRRASRWTDLAQGLLNLETPDVAGARRALSRALAIAPRDVNARYWLARADLAQGRPGEALTRWRALAVDLPADDPARAALQAEIGALERGPEAGDPAIGAMVEGLARRLREQPEDAAGWARLARAYAVLGRERELQGALAEVRRRFTDQPDVVARAEAEAEAGRRVQRAR